MLVGLLEKDAVPFETLHARPSHGEPGART